jgi:hypothetical protein
LTIGEVANQSADKKPSRKNNTCENCCVSMPVAESGIKPKYSKSKIKAHYRPENMRDIQVNL